MIRKSCVFLVFLVLLFTSFAASSITITKNEKLDEQQMEMLLLEYEYQTRNASQPQYIINYTQKIRSDTPDGYSTVPSSGENTDNAGTGNLGGLMDSAWPMKSYDTRHTGRSPYSTIDNNGEELWNFKTESWIEGGSCIGNDGTIYIGSLFGYLYALYNNGTLKWKYETDGWIWSTPAIAQDGTIYIGSWDDYFYAFNPNGTLKWKFFGGKGAIASSPAIANDGTIYYGIMGPDNSGRIFAVNPNGTEKWHYDTGYWITSDPAIGNDGTIYIGSGDHYFYALWPDGTLRWRFKTGDIIKAHPSIAENGTIYISSFDGNLYALNPDGTLKWQYSGGGDEASASIGKDGTIYLGNKYLHAINPNGTRKWRIDVGPNIDHASPAISAEGTIYIGAGKYIIAINPDGTEKWRQKIANNWVESSPCIGRDGTVYIGSSSEDDQGYSYGYLYAFGTGNIQAHTHGPHYGLTNELLQFTGEVTGGYHPYTWQWDFGDNHSSTKEQPTHIYTEPGNYTITLTITDSEGNTSTDTTWAWIQETNQAPSKPSISGINKGTPETHYTYTFTATDPENNPIQLLIDWGDNTTTNWKGPYQSNQTITLTHKWTEKGIYILRARAKDIYENESDWKTMSITIPKTKSYQGFWNLWNQLLNHFLGWL